MSYIECSPVRFRGHSDPDKRTKSDPHLYCTTASWSLFRLTGGSARGSSRGARVAPTRNSAATPAVRPCFQGFTPQDFEARPGLREVRAPLGTPVNRRCAGEILAREGRGIIEAEVAEADGNRTRRGCVATPSYGFEVRGPHQRDNRFRGGVYRKTKGPES